MFIPISNNLISLCQGLACIADFLAQDQKYKSRMQQLTGRLSIPGGANGRSMPEMAERQMTQDLSWFGQVVVDQR